MDNPEFVNRKMDPSGEAAPLACEQLTGNEALLLDFLEGRLASAEAVTLEAHMAGCPECQAACREWQELDLELTHRLHRPKLPAGFTTSLWDKINAVSASKSQLSRAKLKAQLEAEAQARWAEFRKGFFRSQFLRLVDGLGYGIAAAVAGYLLFTLIVPLLNSSATPGFTLPNQQMLQLAMGASAVFLLIGFAFVAKKRLRNLLGEL